MIQYRNVDAESNDAIIVIVKQINSAIGATALLFRKRSGQPDPLGYTPCDLTPKLEIVRGGL